MAISPWWAGLLPAMAQNEVPMVRQRLAIHPGSAADEEELDLGDRSATATSPLAPSDCEPALPSGAPVGIWGPGSPLGSCATKQWAKTQAPLAYAVHDQLWCSDPGSQKSLARQKAMQRAASHSGLAALRDAWELSEKNRHSLPGSFAGYGDLLKAQAWAPRSANPPSVPYYDPSQERALWWDGREAEKCKSWTSSGPELGPALSARSLGKITVAANSCDALLVEANMVAGRHGLSRVSWIASKCAGFASPDPAGIAIALAGGTVPAQAWQDQHFRSWRWQGLEPRSVRARSAEGF